MNKSVFGEVSRRQTRRSLLQAMMIGLSSIHYFWCGAYAAVLISGADRSNVAWYEFSSSGSGYLYDYSSEQSGNNDAYVDQIHLELNSQNGHAIQATALIDSSALNGLSQGAFTVSGAAVVARSLSSDTFNGLEWGQLSASSSYSVQFSVDQPSSITLSGALASTGNQSVFTFLSASVQFYAHDGSITTFRAVAYDTTDFEYSFSNLVPGVIYDISLNATAQDEFNFRDPDFNGSLELSASTQFDLTWAVTAHVAVPESISIGVATALCLGAFGVLMKLW